MFFLGEFTHTLDAKKRLLVPSRFRDLLTDSFVLCKAPEGCLFIYTKEGWQEAAAPLSSGDTTSAVDRKAQRRILRGTALMEMDKQGRVTIPSAFCEYADFNDEIVVFGAMNRIELWNKEEFGKLMQEEPDNDNTPALKY